MRCSLLLGNLDKIYGERFAQYLLNSSKNSFDITSIDKIETFMEHDALDDVGLFILDKAFYQKLLLMNYQNTKQPIIVLEASTTDCIYNDGNIRSLLKYQSMEEIESYIYKTYVDLTNNEPLNYQSKKTKVVGCYSPMGGCGNTIVAKMIAESKQMLNNNVLFVGLDHHSDQGIIFDTHQTYNLSDYSTFLMTKDNWVAGLELMVAKDVHTGIDFIKNPVHVQDMIDFQEDLFEQWIDHIKNYSDYDYIIVDLSSYMPSKLLDFLKKCDTNVFLSRLDASGSVKWFDFLKSMKMVGNEGLIEDGIKIGNNLLDSPIEGAGNWDVVLSYDRDLLKNSGNNLQLNHGSPIFKKVEVLANGF